MPRAPDEMPAELVVFASTCQGDYESRYKSTLRYAWQELGLLINASQLRKLCGGGTHNNATKVASEFRKALHDAYVQRCNPVEIQSWLDAGMPHDMTALSPTERLIAKLFQAYVARLTITH